MRRYASLRRSATLKHKVLSGDASWKYFRFERRIASNYYVKALRYYYHTKTRLHAILHTHSHTTCVEVSKILSV